MSKITLHSTKTAKVSVSSKCAFGRVDKNSYTSTPVPKLNNLYYRNEHLYMSSMFITLAHRINLPCLIVHVPVLPSEVETEVVAQYDNSEEEDVWRDRPSLRFKNKKH